MTVNEMLEKRGSLIAQARALYDKAETEKREATAEEREQFDRMMDEADKLKADADRLTKLEAEETALSESRGRQTELERADDSRTNETVTENRTVDLRESVVGDTRQVVIPDMAVEDRRIAAFNRCLLQGMNMGLAAEGEAERRALQKDSDTVGGYLSAPLQWQAELIQELDNMVFMRQLCRVLPPITTADTLGAPSLDTDLSDLDWTTELGTGSEDSSLALGKRELTPHPMAKLVKISKTLLRRSTIGADGLVRERIAYKNGTVQENAFLNGTGSQQPLGVFTASDDGISTGRDVSTGNTTTSMTFDGLMEAVYSLKAQYRQRNCAWIFHRDGVKQLRKLKDGEGRYIWQAGVVAGTPDTILTYPVYESEYAPSTFTTGLYVGILGDYSYYWIVDAMTLAVQVLVELYAATNQNGYIARSEGDGMPILESAFARVKLA